MSSSNYTPGVPQGFILPQPISTSKAIYKKQLIEIQPTEQSTYTPNSYNLLRFNIASNTDYWRCRESYMRLYIQRSAGLGAADYAAALDVGGIHCIARNIELRDLQSGSLIDRADDYNRRCVITKLLHETPMSTAQCGWTEGDSIQDGEKSKRMLNDQVMVSPELASVAVSVFTSAENNLTALLNVGDELILTSAIDGNDVAYTVLEVLSASTALISAPPALTIVPGGILELKYRKLYKVESARVDAVRVAGTPVLVCMKPMLSFFDHDIPMFVFPGGIEVRMELEVGARAIKTNLDFNTSVAQNYEITQPRFMCMMVTPHHDIRDEVLTKFKSPEGLKFNIPGVRTRRTTFNKDLAGPINMQMHVGVRSARFVVAVIQDSELAEGSGALTAMSNSLSRFFRSNATRFQFKIGSHEFPHREVICDDFSNEAYMQVKNSCLLYNRAGSRLSREDWQTSLANAVKVSQTTRTTALEKHFMFFADLSRDNGEYSEMTGADLSVVPLDFELSARGAAHSASGLLGSPVVYFFIFHDQVLRIASDGITVSS